MNISEEVRYDQGQNQCARHIPEQATILAIEGRETTDEAGGGWIGATMCTVRFGFVTAVVCHVVVLLICFFLSVRGSWDEQRRAEKNYTNKQQTSENNKGKLQFN